MWSNISEKTGVDDIDELVLTFMQLEQKKMTKVKEANTLIEQIKQVGV